MPEKLQEYNEKRDFAKTKEPAGKLENPEGKLRFVVQRHAASRLHYDFRLEMDGVLKSWAVPKGPSLNPNDKRLAMHVEDHPVSYRNFQGHIPEKEYGGGEVEIWDEGFYEPLVKKNSEITDDAEMQSELESGSLKFVMYGKKLQGEFALVKIKSDTSGKSWLLLKHRDQFSVSTDYNSEDFVDEDSAVSAYLLTKNKGRETGNLAARKKFHGVSGGEKFKNFISPMLASSSLKPFDSEDWIFEIKWDGYRAVADLRDEVRLYSRNGLDFSKKFSKIKSALSSQKYEMILDGEIVAYNREGRPDFQILQNYAENPSASLIFQVFDLLWLNGHSTENLTVIQRKELLKSALVENDFIKYCDHISGKGTAFFDLAEKNGLEGIIAKKSDSTYAENSRSNDWLKIKVSDTEEVVICGYTEPSGARKHFGSLILGNFQGGKLQFCGHAGTGFSDKLLDELFVKFQKLLAEDCPFYEVPAVNGKAFWLKPELIAEVKFSEKTKDGIFRHPVFLHLREDKSVEDLAKTNPITEKIQTKNPKIISENSTEKTLKNEENSLPKVNISKVKLSNPDKIYFPELGISKKQIVDYYLQISDFILPFLKDRPQSLYRFPNGIHGMSFYQKDAPAVVPDFVETVKVYSESNQKFINYILCNNVETLAYLANLGCIELNVWTSRYQSPENPDYLVLDLDPSENNSFDDVKEAALVVKQVLDSAGITGYPKTSGSTGIHIYIPCGGRYNFEQIKNFAHLLMQLVYKFLPNLTTLERSLQRRDKGKIYLDYLQNRSGQTLASVYSLRPKVDATVSMPISWNEINEDLSQNNFTIYNAAEEIEKRQNFFLRVLSDSFDMLKVIDILQRNV